MKIWVENIYGQKDEEAAKILRSKNGNERIYELFKMVISRRITRFEMHEDNGERKTYEISIREVTKK